MALRQLRHLARKPIDFLRLPVFIVFSTLFLMPLRILGFLRMATSVAGAPVPVRTRRRPDPVPRPPSPRRRRTPRDDDRVRRSTLAAPRTHRVTRVAPLACLIAAPASPSLLAPIASRKISAGSAAPPGLDPERPPWRTSSVGSSTLPGGDDIVEDTALVPAQHSRDAVASRAASASSSACMPPGRSGPRPSQARPGPAVPVGFDVGAGRPRARPLHPGATTHDPTTG